MDVEVGGILILRDGEIRGGDPFVFYTGTYECSDGKWNGESLARNIRRPRDRWQNGSNTSDLAAPTTTQGPKPMPQSWLVRAAFGTTPRCTCWQRLKLDLYGKGRSLVGSSFLPTGQPVFPLALDRSGDQTPIP